MQDVVLVIGAGILPTYMIQTAQAMGLTVIAVDGNPSAPGAAVADMLLPVDAYDAEAVAARIPSLQQTYKLLGVCTSGCDAAPTVSLCAERAGLPGIPYATACRTHNKLSVRLRLTREGLSQYQPEYAEYMRYEDTETWDTFPCVVKPLSQRASRGVSIVPTREELRSAIQEALVYGDEYLIEQCLTGTEHSAEAIFDAEGQPCFFNIVDRFFDYTSGTGIELGHINPSALSVEAWEGIATMVREAAAALGVTFGPFKCDVMLTTDGPKILECTSRLSGGLDSQLSSPMTGRHPMRQVLQLACSLPVDPQPAAQGYAACAAILPTKTGMVYTLPVCPVEQGEVIWGLQPGEMLHPIAHNGVRPGFVVTQASTYEAAWSFAKHIADTLAAALDAQIEAV